MSVSIPVRYQTAKHRKLLEAFNARMDLGKKDISQQHDQLNEADDRFLAYLPENAMEKDFRSLRSDGKPQYTTIHMPTSYAIAMTAHTYMTSVFLARSPVLQYTGRHGEGQTSVQAVEAMMDYQVNVGAMLVPWYIWLLEPFKYGYSILGLDWDREEITTSEIVEEEEVFLGVLKTGKTRRKKRTKTSVGYIGNKVYNVNPRSWYPDPRVPMNQFQQGEFCAVTNEIGWLTVRERESRGIYFNVDVLKRMKSAGGQGDMRDVELGSASEIFPEGGDVGTSEIPDVGTVGTTQMYIKLIPRDWGLGKGERPEIWVMTVAEKRVIIELRPYGALHGKYPFILQESEPEAYALFRRSIIEILTPLQYTLDWLFNTHFYNIRKTLNDQFLVDPTLVYMSDVTNPLPGKLIRLRPKAARLGLQDRAIQQLRVQDVTQQHMRDTSVILEMMQRATGVTDNLMGLVNAGGRKTATEVRTSTTFGINRLKTVAEYFSAMAWSPMSQMMLQATQQYYDQSMYFKIAGNMVNQNAVENLIEVTPERIQGFFDFVAVDGTLPVDRFAQANLWRELLTQMRNFPELAQQYDLSKIFAFIANLAGLKNLDQFRVNIVPDEQLDREREAGNIVGIGDPDGRTNRGPEITPGAEGRGADELARVPEPGQISGMGTT